MMRTTVYLVLVLGLFAKLATLSLGIRVEIPGRCSNVCVRNVQSAFFSCIDEIDRGCALRLCDSPARAVKCGLKSGFPDEIFTGEEVSVSDVRVSRGIETKIGIRGLSPKTDVYFLVDGTGSMGAAIGALKRSFTRLTEALKKTGDFAYGVGTFRDETELNMGFRHLQGISTNVSRVKQGMGKLQPEGGDDADEANLVALYKVATGDFVKWRAGAGRVVILFGDAVGHEPTCFDDVVLTRRVVSRALLRAKITVQAVATEFSTMDNRASQFGCGGDEDGAGTGQTTFIAEKSGGSLTTLGTDSAAEVFNVFSGLLRNAGTVVDVAKSSCDRAIRFTFDPPLPASLRVGPRLKTTVTLRRRVCRRGSIECSVSFKSGDSVSEPLKLKFSDLTGCPSE